MHIHAIQLCKEIIDSYESLQHQMQCHMHSSQRNQYNFCIKKPIFI